MHRFNVLLILGLRLIDRCDDSIGVRALQGKFGKFFLEAKVDISALEVVIVHLDRAQKGTRLRADQPRCLPRAAPERIEVRIDAADVDLKVSILVSAEAGPGRVIPVVTRNLLIHGGFHAGPIINV